MLKRYGDNAAVESTVHAHELMASGYHDGAAVWCRITDAVAQLANKTPRPGALTP
jgi:hypothetical protein